MNFKQLYERLISAASTNVNTKADNMAKAAANNVVGDEYLKQYLINAVQDDNNLADNPNTFKYYPYSGFMGKLEIYIKILFEKSENDGLYLILLKYDLRCNYVISKRIIGEISFEDDSMIFKNTKYCPSNLVYLKHVIENGNEWSTAELYNDDAQKRQEEKPLKANKNIEACNELLQAILRVLKRSCYLEQIDKDINERLIQNAASGINKEANNISDKVFGASLGDMADEFRLILKDTFTLDDKNEEYWDNFPVKAGGLKSYNTHKWNSRFKRDFIKDNPYLLGVFAWHLSTASKSKLYDYMIGQNTLTKYGLNGNICTYIYYQPGHSDYLWHVSSYFIPHDEELIKEHVTKVKFVDFTIDKNDPTIKHLREYDDQRYEEKIDATWDPSYKEMIEKRDYAFVSKLGQIIKSSIPNIPEYIEKAKSYIATNYKDRYKKSSYIFDPKTPEGIIEKTIYTKIPKEIASNDNISMFDAMSKLYNRSIYVDDNGNNYMFDYDMSEHEEGATNTPIISATFKIPQIAKYNGQTYMTYKMDKKTAIIDVDSSKMNNNFLYINGIMTPYGKAFIQELVNTLFQLKDENDDLYDKRLSFAESNKDNEDVNEKIEDM